MSACRGSRFHSRDSVIPRVIPVFLCGLEPVLLVRSHQRGFSRATGSVVGRSPAFLPCRPQWTTALPLHGGVYWRWIELLSFIAAVAVACVGKVLPRSMSLPSYVLRRRTEEVTRRVFFRLYGTDTPFVRERREYEKTLHTLRRQFREAYELERADIERARKARVEAAQQQQRREAAEHHRKLETLKERLRKEVKPIKPSPDAAPVVVIDPVQLDAYCDEFGLGYVTLARRAVEKELRRADEGTESTQALRDAERSRAIMRKHVELRLTQLKRMRLAQILQAQSDQWITRDRLDAIVDTVVRELFESKRESL